MINTEYDSFFNRSSDVDVKARALVIFDVIDLGLTRALSVNKTGSLEIHASTYS